ncbi:transcriptional regulator, PadR family [Stackebrandtia albiflava]|uniref:Transcriptional regulator, PadR family n=1 Tax=Stackebrandtia albiflava TaxID=406432 RepID=A0A562VAC7_9ACTN|nr:helix-turn-helix transcriptional regulator [Stackebrandtia albiflava]TWJ14803.1 transcriptional regulator, PadR family [Stackebrandtia albiflava]
MNSASFAWQGPRPMPFDVPRFGAIPPFRMHHSGEERRGRRHRGHRGGWGGGGFGFGGPWGAQIPPVPPLPPMPPFPPGGGRRGRKARRGDVRAAILALLNEGPHNGYQIIQEIGERSQGAWRPSPGAVYPALQQLSDEELVQPVGEGRKTVYELTEAGRTHVAEHSDEVNAPWESMIPKVDDSVWELFELAAQSSAALMQVAQSGAPAQVARAKKVLNDTRRALYQILADGDDDRDDDA